MYMDVFVCVGACVCVAGALERASWCSAVAQSTLFNSLKVNIRVAKLQ